MQLTMQDFELKCGEKCVMEESCGSYGFSYSNPENDSKTNDLNQCVLFNKDKTYDFDTILTYERDVPYYNADVPAETPVFRIRSKVDPVPICENPGYWFG